MTEEILQRAVCSNASQKSRSKNHICFFDTSRSSKILSDSDFLLIVFGQFVTNLQQKAPSTFSTQ